MAIHAEQGSILGGVHLELTGEVNEDGFSVVSLPFSLSPFLLAVVVLAADIPTFGFCPSTD